VLPGFQVPVAAAAELVVRRRTSLRCCRSLAKVNNELRSLFSSRPETWRSPTMTRLAALGWGLLVLAVAATGASAAGEKDDNAAEIKRLLVERQQTLRAAADVLMIQYKRGQADFQRVAHAQRAFLRATLDLPQSPEKRLAALQESRDLADATVKVAEARFKVGTATKADVLEAQAALLEARIELLREQAKARPRK
jgi:hypothetical protein